MILQRYKLVFAGSMGAGKSTAIQTISSINVLSTEAVNTDLNAHKKTQTTVGIDYGELILEDGNIVGLYGTPGQERFDFIWDIITEGTLGVILLIDHTAEHPIGQLNEYLNYYKAKVSNIIIGITHLDSKTQHNSSIYHEWLDQQDINYPLFFIDARDKRDILLLVDALITQAEVLFELN